MWMVLFCHFFFRLMDIMFCKGPFTQGASLVRTQCIGTRVYAEKQQRKWRRRVRTGPKDTVFWVFVRVCCGTADQVLSLWYLFVQPVTSGSPLDASSALLLTALSHCFKHIKQCCWSLPLLIENVIIYFLVFMFYFDFFYVHGLWFIQGQHSSMLCIIEWR